MSEYFLKYSRVYSDSEGISHFSDEQIKISGWGEGREFIGTSLFQDAEKISFMKSSMEIDMGWHRAPRRQFLLYLQGNGEIEVGDGANRFFNVGDIVLVEDVSGKGHKSTAGKQGVLMAAIPIPD